MSQSAPIVSAPQGTAREANGGAFQQGARKAPRAHRSEPDPLQVLAQLRYLVEHPKAPAPFRSRVLAQVDALLETA